MLQSLVLPEAFRRWRYFFQKYDIRSKL